VTTWPGAELSGRLPASYLGLDRTTADIIEGRPCVCGGMVWANPADPRQGVDIHNATDCHRAWWELERDAWEEL
jgi:hypothetical protein